MDETTEISVLQIRMSSHKIESLQGKTLLFVARNLGITSGEDIPVSIWRTLKELGLKSVVVVLQKSCVNSRWCSTLKALGVIEQYNVDGLVNGKWDDARHAEADAAAIVSWLESENIEINALASNDDYGPLVCSYVGKHLGVRTNSCESMKATSLKDVTLNAVLQDPDSSNHGVPSHVVETEEELITVVNNLRFPIVLKPVTTSGCRGCKLVHDLSECRDFFKILTGDKENGYPSVLVMEYVDGPKYCVDVVIDNGQLIGGATSQRGPAVLPYFWQIAKMVPGDVTEDVHDELVTAAYKCCTAVGIDHGVFNVDLILDEASVPKMLEINPRPAGSKLTEVYKEVYEIDIMLLYYLLCCDVELGVADLRPKRHAVGYCLLLQVDGEKERIQRALGNILSMTKDYGISLVNPAMKTAKEILVEGFETHKAILMMVASDEISHTGAVESMARFLVDTTYFDSISEALSRFQ